jgi:hypothetical protein
MKTTVIYHSADFDGIFCREIARKFLPPDTEFIGWDFGDSPLPSEVLDGMSAEGNTIYVMDLPIDQLFGFKWHGPDNSDSRTKCIMLGLANLFWIDHHKTNIETHPIEFAGYRIDGVAACRLAWQWFTMHGDGHQGDYLAEKQDFIDRKVSEPWAVQLAGEYDIWDKRDPDAELFQFGLKSRELTEADWYYMLLIVNDLSITPKITEELLESGKPLQYARAKEYAEVIQQQGFTLKWEGLTFLACNSHELDIRSQLFEAGIKPEHDGLIGFTFCGHDWRVSLYGVPGKPDIDLSWIAKKYGGGGHRQACGFRRKELPWMAKPYVDYDVLIEYLEGQIPEKNCSCHINPPCGWCTDWMMLKEQLDAMRAIRDAK